MPKIKPWIVFVLLFILIFGAFTYAAHTAFLNNTPGIDYFIFWNAGRAFFAHQDPYAPEVDQQIQTGLYGHPAQGNENRMEYAYPPYALFIVLPFLWMDFGWSQAAWMSFNLLLVITLAYLLFPKAPKWVNLTLPFLYPFAFGFILGNFVVSISAVLLVFLRFLIDPNRPSRKMEILLGVLMAWAAVKPQFVWLFVILFFLYGVRQRLWTMLASFCASLLVMVLASLAVRADSILKWLEQLAAYNVYNNSPSLLNRFLALVVPDPLLRAPFFVMVALGVITVFLLFRWWTHRIDPLFVIIWLAFVTFLVHPGGGGGVSYEELIYLIPFYLWAALEKPSLPVALTWAAGWVLSYVFNTVLVFKNPLQVEYYLFVCYAIWMIWIFARPARAPRLLYQEG